jgi:uncharacterized protein
VLWFFALAYALSWAWWMPVALAQPEVERREGWPTHVPGLLGPMLAAFIVVAVTEGRRGVRELLASMVRWPDEPRWQVATLSPLVFLAAALGSRRCWATSRRSGTSASSAALRLAVSAPRSSC